MFKLREIKHAENTRDDSLMDKILILFSMPSEELVKWMKNIPPFLKQAALNPILSHLFKYYSKPWVSIHSAYTIVFKTVAGACFHIQPNTTAWMPSLTSIELCFSWKGKFSAIKASYFCSSSTKITINKKNPWMTCTINSLRFFLKSNKATEIMAYPALCLRVTAGANQTNQPRDGSEWGKVRVGAVRRASR